MTYGDILRVNNEMEMLDLKGKAYAMVPERVTAFRKLYPDGFITTDIVSNDGTTVLMQAKVGYYAEDGNPVILGTGLAQEVKGKGLVNGTSHIENAETSAVGRALGMLGLGIGGGGICSAEELANAVTAQRQMAAEPAPEFTRPAVGRATVVRASELPVTNKPVTPAKEASPVAQYLLKEMGKLREERKITPKENNILFRAQHDALIEAKLAPDKKLEEYTMEEAEALIDAMYKCFSPKGTELKTE